MATTETQKAYQAEFLLRDITRNSSTVTMHGCVVTVPVERQFADIESIQRYVDAVLKLNWVRAAYAAASTPLVVKQKPLRTANVASCGSGVMLIPITTTNRWALREIVVLHELAHHLVPWDSHGLAFRTCFAHLVEELIGPELAWCLRTSFLDQGLNVNRAPEFSA